jgi:hypothetical protein
MRAMAQPERVVKRFFRMVGLQKSRYSRTAQPGRLPAIPRHALGKQSHIENDFLYSLKVI